jgi:Zn-dependent protease with chaperone function/Flp pilus assembly protein TadD
MRGAAKWSLSFRAGLIVLLFYALAVASILFLTFCVALEFAGGFIGRRFWWAAAVRGALRTHFNLLKAFARGLRLPKMAEARIPLQPAEAEELFLMIETLCARAQMAAPRQVLLEMQMNAWVRLGGLGRGSGKVVLGLGYDLLAGLTREELEVVLAHELTHAKVTRRWTGLWLARGLERAVQVARGLRPRAAPRRRNARVSVLGRFFLTCSDGLAESAARWIAAASRQEEFAADRGAAALCGGALARATLLRVEALSRFAARLPWRERVAQLQAHTFSPWLVKELAGVKTMDFREIEAEVPDRFSTHPSLRDRWNAIPSDGAEPPPPDTRPAIEMLAEADLLAEKLMAKIQQTTIEQEDRDSRELRRWARKMRTASQMHPVQIFGAALVVAAEIAGAAVWIFGASLEVVFVIFLMAVLGLLIYWLARYREQFELPTPDFALLKRTWSSERSASDLVVKAMQSAWRARAAGKSKARTAAMLEAKCLAFLRECDYAKAEAAARLCLDLEPDSLAALMASAIAAAWHGQGAEAAHALSTVQEDAGLRGRSICWGAAWTYMLRGNWGRAEALLHQALDARPADPTLLNLRALCQSRRGKIQSAIISARRACTPSAVNHEHAKFLVDLLLEGGYLREAQQRLAPLDKYIRQDAELMLTAVRLNLLLRDLAAADHWADTLLKDDPPAYLIVRLAVLYEMSLQTEPAARFYRAALARAYFPDACLGLARVEAQRNNTAAARQHTLAALNLGRATGRFATPPLELLRPILSQLGALEAPSRSCRGWVATLGANASSTALAGRSFLVYGASQAQAERFMQTVLEALAPDGPRLAAVQLVWRPAAPEDQPAGMVRPGVQPPPDDRDLTPFARFQRRGTWQPHYAPMQPDPAAFQPLTQCA